MAIQPVPYALNSPSVKLISLQFNKKNVVWELVKSLTKVKIHDISCSSLIHQCSHSIVEGPGLVRRYLSLMKLCYLSLISSLSFICLDVASRRICCMISLGTEVRLSGRSFPGSFFLHFLKISVVFSFFESLEVSPDCDYFSNMMEKGLTTTSAKSLRILGCISSGPMDLYVVRFLRWSQT